MIRRITQLLRHMSFSAFPLAFLEAHAPVPFLDLLQALLNRDARDPAHHSGKFDTFPQTAVIFYIKSRN